jgi:hypothetical protein|tara:strand:- start:1664 stop:1780 length:117 start_codon:yes stop_codon:yes gene_type:complete
MAKTSFGCKFFWLLTGAVVLYECGASPPHKVLKEEEGF